MELGPIQLKWLQSLKDHPERQGFKSLGYKKIIDDYAACCLGELGLISGICSFEGNVLKSGIETSLHDSLYLREYDQVGLYSQRGDIKNYTIILGSIDLSLSELNDNGKSWPDIAAIVESDPEKYFYKSV